MVKWPFPNPKGPGNQTDGMLTAAALNTKRSDDPFMAEARRAGGMWNITTLIRWASSLMSQSWSETRQNMTHLLQNTAQW